MLDRRPDPDEERVGPGGRVRPREDRVHAVHRERPARVDADDVGVRPGRAHETGVARVGGEGNVVRELGLAGDEGRVLHPRDRPSDHPGTLWRPARVPAPARIFLTAPAGRWPAEGFSVPRGAATT